MGLAAGLAANLVDTAESGLLRSATTIREEPEVTGPSGLAEHRPTDLIGTGPAELRQAFGTKAAEACELEWDCRQLDLPVGPAPGC